MNGQLFNQNCIVLLTAAEWGESLRNRDREERS